MCVLVNNVQYAQNDKIEKIDSNWRTERQILIAKQHS